MNLFLNLVVVCMCVWGRDSGIDAREFRSSKNAGNNDKSLRAARRLIADERELTVAWNMEMNILFLFSFSFY